MTILASKKPHKWPYLNLGGGGSSILILINVYVYFFLLVVGIHYSAGKRDRGKKTPRESGGEAPRLHRTGGEAPCSMKGRKTRREENVFKGVENLPALLYTIV